jgi:hypothetical protein
MIKITYENFIGIYENAFSQEYCDKAIKYFKDMQQAGLSQTRLQNENAQNSVKDDVTVFPNFEETINIGNTKELIAEFNGIFWGQCHKEYANQFSVLQNFEPYGSFSARIQKTLIGGGYHIWHCESMQRTTSNRILAWTLYLNDVEEGGETEFLYYPKRVKPKAGTLILWPAGFTHIHRGNPPISNEKYIITGWAEF